MRNRYTIRYRSDNRAGKTALIVEDDGGAAYLFSGGCPQTRLTGSTPCVTLAQLLARQGRWLPVPEVAAYTLGDLRRLAAPTGSPDDAGPRVSSGLATAGSSFAQGELP